VKVNISESDIEKGPVKDSQGLHDYLPAIFNSLEDELMVVDRDYQIIEVNEAFLSRHGRHRREVIGKYCYEIAHGQNQPCHIPDHECPLKAVWETRKPVRVTHCHVYHVNGEKGKRYVEIIASPIEDKHGNVIAITELMRDVTRAKEMEATITEAHQNLLALNTIAITVSQSLDPDTVLYSAINKTLEVMNRNTGGILLWDEEKQKLCYRVHSGLSQEYARAVCFLPGEGIVGKVAQSGEAILVDDISKDARAANHTLIAAEGLRAFAAVPLRVKEKVLGVLTIASHDARKFSTEDIQLLESIASQIAIAVENARLHQEVQRKDESRGELLGEIFAIQEEERRRIARELHDETSQSLASLAASLEAVVGMLPSGTDEAKLRLKKGEQVAISILDETHRLIYELRPTLLDDLGLVAASRWLTENNLGAGGVAVNFKTSGRVRRLPSRIETTLFRVIQEAVSNIAKHAHARNVNVALNFRKGAIAIHVGDDGEGFDVDEAISSRNRPRGLGLLGMKERVELMKGTLRITSQHGSGTEVDIEIPTNQRGPGG
jgi:PAS domain S-box-containing protein